MTDNSTSLPEGAGATTGGNGGHGSEEWRAGPGSTHREIEVVETGPSAAVVAGAALAGAIVGAAVPFMLSGRSSGTSRHQTATVEESVIIDRPPREIYDFWRNFENLPRFMDNIESVTRINDVRSHWKIKAPAGTSVEFNSLVTEDIPGRLIAWKSEEGASVPNRGRVEFIETSAGGGTNVRTTISYDPPAGAFGRIVARLFQREPGVQARQDLDRLKQLLES
ncbi:MAG TPA: SRPBCC family protein [Allosphingosinicella sp.]|nr:SRPBCC family protein [Allosphingosinicella sp.]